MQFNVGQLVRVKSFAGIETGRIASINHTTGKADIFFNYPACPHYCAFNISQIMEVAA